jgi:hypothetical protein
LRPIPCLAWYVLTSSSARSAMWSASEESIVITVVCFAELLRVVVDYCA